MVPVLDEKYTMPTYIQISIIFSSRPARSIQIPTLPNVLEVSYLVTS